jgi:FRG domain-containing protein
MEPERPSPESPSPESGGVEGKDADNDVLPGLPSHPIFGTRDRCTVHVTQPTSLDELIGALSRTNVEWIWRGQASAGWPLVTRLGRAFEHVPKPEQPGSSLDYIGLENRVIGYFKERARRVLATAPDDSDLLSWLAMMQHYGAPTRLLDWTMSPFVALWFAYEHADERAEKGALWGLNAYFCRRGITGSLVPGGWDHLGTRRHSHTNAEGNTVTTTPALDVRQRDRENDFLRWTITVRSRWPLPLIPFDADARMAVQQTVLTAIGDLEQSVDHMLLRFEQWQHEPPSEPPPGGYRIGTESTVWPLIEPAQLIQKVLLPLDWRVDALRALASMGIDAGTLFPGLDGVGRATAAYLHSGGATLREVITDMFSA